MKLQIESLLQQTMTRKEFLRYVGSAILVLFGISTVLKSLQTNQSASTKTSMGYGSDAYGGR